MSASYTLHVAPDAVPGDPQALDRADLVRDGFTWWAALAPALWFALHRHWLLALGAIVATAGLAAALALAGATPGSILAAEILLHLLIGLEAASLRGWVYGLRHRPAVDVVFAGSEGEAEAKSFARWLAPSGPPPPPRLAGRAAPFMSGREQIIGLFPDLEGRPDQEGRLRPETRR